MKSLGTYKFTGVANFPKIGKIEKILVFGEMVK